MSNAPYEVQVQTTFPNNATSAFTNPPYSVTTAGCTNQASNLVASSIYQRTASLYWNNPNYDYYSVVQYRAVGAAVWSQTPFPSYRGSNSVYLENLLPGTVYEWRVVTYCTPSQAANPSATQRFTTVACPSSQLSGFSTIPDHNSVSISWSENWPQTNSYVVRYRAVGATSYSLLGPQSGLSATLSGLSNNTAYEWQVAPVCDASATSYSFAAPQSFTTTCRQPIDGLYTQNNQGNAIQVYWYSSIYASEYLLRYRPLNASDWQTQTALNTNSVSLTGLQTNTTYEWEVARQCAVGLTSNFRVGPSFQTTCRNALGGFSTQAITATRANIEFYDNDYRSAYQLRYRVTGTANWTTVALASRSYALTGLSPYTAYEWQVAGQCNPTLVSDFSPVQTFITDCFTPSSPYSSPGYGSIYLHWQTNANVASYTVQYRQQGLTDWQSVTVTGGTYTVSNTAGTYEWRVRANCDGAQSSEYSAIQTFSTSCSAPGQPVASNLNSYAALLTWAPATLATSYALQWRLNGTATWTTLSPVSPPTYTLTGLTDNTTYQVRVQSQCGNVPSEFSPITVFGAVCSAPTGLRSSLAYYFTEPGRRLTWTATPGITYNLRWRRLNDPAAEWHLRTVVPSGAYTITQFLPGVYEWQVQSVCANGTQSAFVGGEPFEISPCGATPVTNYSSLVAHTSATLLYAYGSVTELRWRPAGSGGWNVASQLSSSSFSLAGLTENTAYEWQVRVLCPTSLTTAFGPLQTFTTTCGQPTALRTVCVQPTDVRVGWEGPASSIYEVNWRVYGTATWNTTLVTGTQATLTGLASGSQYEWQVRPACSSVSSTTFSRPSLFYTYCASPTNLVVTRNSSCNYVASWQGCSAEGYTVRVRHNYGNWIEYSTSSTAYTVGNFTSGYVEVEVISRCNDANSSTASTWLYPSACQASATITNLNQYIDGTTASLTWQTSCGLVNLRWRPAGGTWTTVQTTANSYQLTGLTVDALYEWQLRSTCANQANEFGPIQFFRTQCQTPITEIYGIWASSNAIRFFYNDNPVATQVRYRPEGGTWITVPAAATSPMLLTSLAANIRYELQIRRSCSAAAWSAWSPSRYATTFCPGPTQLYASSIAETAVVVNWTYESYGASAGYGRALRYRRLGTTTWLTADLSNVPISPPYSYSLTGLSPQTTYEWQVVYDCGAGETSATTTQPITFRTAGALACTSMITIQDGNWNDAATWSCGRVPTATDTVQIRHSIRLPIGLTSQVTRLHFEAGGSLHYEAGAGIITVR